MKQLFILLFCFSAALFSCNYTMKIRDGQTAFTQKQYAVAVEFLQKEIKKAERRTEQAKIAFLLGESYRNNSQFEQALPWYKMAYDNGFGVDALKQYAFTLKALERYGEAVENFQQLGIEIGSLYEYRKEITACKLATDWKKLSQKEWLITPLAINGKGSEFAPLPFRDRKLLYSTDKTTSEAKEKYQWTGRSFMDLYVADLQSDASENFSSTINSVENEATSTFSSDYQELFFTRCSGDVDNVSYCKIFTSRFENGAWSSPQLLDFQVENANYMHPSLSADGAFLYFASDHQEGFGGYDIYVAERTVKGWDSPKLLNRSINTAGNDAFPFIDNDTLYFSSDYHTGMGGLDIFRVYKLEKDRWSAAQNLLPPLNSGADDFGYVIDYQAEMKKDVLRTGYFSSNRPGGSGNDDIYKFEKIVPPAAPVEPPKDQAQLVYKLILEGYVLEKIYADPADPNSKVLGRKPIQNAAVIANFGKEKLNFTTDETGFFTLELFENQDYTFFASKETYLNREESFSTKGVGKDPAHPVQKFELEIVLDKIFVNKEITLENIYYDFDKWDIRADAQPTLNQLAKDLLLNPELKIQLASHTDCRGNDNYNLDLSQKRAQSAVDYLISKGVPTGRLVARGFGETAPSVGCICTRCTESEHQANRRTTFTIFQ